MSPSTDILHADLLLAQAQAETGLTDWGDDTLPERFRLAAAFLQSCNMDEAGQRAGAAACLWLLTDRLRFFEDFKRYPIGEEQIERPMFATGEARSGTTLLHALLSVDPNGRALRFWEVMNPSPPPGVTGSDDPRRAKADADWREINTRLPVWLVSHPYNDMLGDGLPEDERTWSFDFRVMTTTAWWRVPFGMNTTGLPANPSAQYRIHKMMLQQFQYRLPKKYWVLKGFHGQRLRELFDTYPDACIVWAHRDPVQTAASHTKLMVDLVEGLVGHVDVAEQAKSCLARTRSNIAATLTDPMVNDPRIYHIRYPDFVADPVSTIRGFYEYSGVPFTSEVEQAMRDYLNNNKGDRYGKFKYSTDLLKADIDALNREFAPFRKRFGLEIEKRA
jgi:Sulfotransferase family